MTYKFDQFKSEIVDPEIKINSISVDVTLIVNNAKIGVNLTDIKISDVNCGDTLTDIVLKKLEEFKI
jgi:hypothetical protein